MKKLLTGDRMGGVLFDVQIERKRQDELCAKGKFPWTCASPVIPDAYKLAVLAEEFGEASIEVNEMLQAMTRSFPDDPPQMVMDSKNRVVTRRKKLLRTELVQVAAVCVAWCEALDEQQETGISAEWEHEPIPGLYGATEREAALYADKVAERKRATEMECERDEVRALLARLTGGSWKDGKFVVMDNKETERREAFNNERRIQLRNALNDAANNLRDFGIYSAADVARIAVIKEDSFSTADSVRTPAVKEDSAQIRHHDMRCNLGLDHENPICGKEDSFSTADSVRTPAVKEDSAQIRHHDMRCNLGLDHENPICGTQCSECLLITDCGYSQGHTAQCKIGKTEMKDKPQ